MKIHGNLWLLLHLCLSGAFCSAADSKVSLALIAGQGSRAPSNSVLDRLEVRMTQEKGVAVLERKEIDRILREQKLSASGLVERDSAVRLGQICRADLFLIVERFSTANLVEYRFQFIDTRTGLALGSHFLPAAAVEKDTEGIVPFLSHALGWLQTPEGERRYIGFLGYHAEQRGANLDGVPDALAAILAHELSRSSNVLVVDREHLEKLQMEQDLTGVDMQLALSAFLIEGELRPGVEKTERVRINTVLHPVKGATNLPVLLTECALTNLMEVARGIAGDILRQLNAQPLAVVTNTAAVESQWFLGQAGAMQRYGEVLRSVPPAESAYVLNPRPEIGLFLADTLAKAGAIRGAKPDLAEADRRAILHDLIRVMHLWIPLMVQKTEKAKGTSVPFMDYPGAPHFFGKLWEQLRSNDSETSALYDELKGLKAKARELELAYARELWPKHRYGPNRIPGSTGYYQGFLIKENWDMQYAAESGAEYVGWWKAQMSHWLDMPGYTSAYFMWSMLTVGPHFTLQNKLPERLSDAESRRQLRNWCEWMTQQNSLDFKMAGYYGNVLLLKGSDAQEADAAFRQLLALYSENLKCHGYNQIVYDVLRNSMVRKPVDPALAKEGQRVLVEAPLNYLDRRQFVAWYNQHISGRNRQHQIKGLGNEIALQWVEKALNKLPPKGLARYRNELAQAAIDATYEDLQGLRYELLYAGKAPEPEIGPAWKNYAVESFRPDGDLSGTHVLALLKRDGNAVLRVWMKADPHTGETEIRAQSGDLRGKQVRDYAPCVLKPGTNGPAFSVRDAAGHEKEVFIATSAGLLRFAPGATRRYTREDGLPHENVSALAVAGDRLLIGFNPDYLCVMDLKHGSLKELAYSRSVLKRNPLDGCDQRLVVGGLIRDPNQPIVWMMTQAPEGLWTISLGEGSITRAGSSYPGSLSWQDARLVAQPVMHLGPVSFDVVAKKWKPIRICPDSHGFCSPYLFFGKDVISAGTILTSVETTGGSSFTYRGKGGLYLHKPMAREPAHYPLTSKEKPLQVDYMIPLSTEKALLATKSGQFWKLTDLHKESPEEKAVDEQLRRRQAFVQTQTNEVKVIGVEASSCVASNATASFAAANLCDGKPGTCWAAVTNETVGAWFSVELERPALLSSLRVVNGWISDPKNLTMYPNNHRVKTLEITTDAGEKALVELEDHNDPQFVIPDLRKKARKLTFTVKAIYEAEVNDPEDPPWLNLSEIGFCEGPVFQKESR